MLYTLVGILLVIWLIGLIAKIGGSFIHLLLLIALAMFVYNLIVSRRKPR